MGGSKSAANAVTIEDIKQKTRSIQMRFFLFMVSLLKMISLIGHHFYCFETVLSAIANYSINSIIIKAIHIQFTIPIDSVSIVFPI